MLAWEEFPAEEGAGGTCGNADPQVGTGGYSAPTAVCARSWPVWRVSAVVLWYISSVYFGFNVFPFWGSRMFLGIHQLEVSPELTGCH